MGSGSGIMDVDMKEPQEEPMVSDSSAAESGPSSTSADFQMASETPPTPPPLQTQSGRPRHDYRLPKRFRDNLPEPPAPVPSTLSNPNPGLQCDPIRRVVLIVRDRLVTVMNSFGIWRDYPERPTVDPDAFLTLEDLSNSRSNAPSHNMPSATHFSESRPPHWPFLNKTVHAVMQWLNNGQTAKSEAETTKFVHDVILSPTFNPADLTGFDAHRENQRLDKALSLSDLRSQFMESSVDILVPSGEIGVEPKTFTVPGLLHRNLTSVIREAFQSPLARLYHYSPFKLFRKSPISGRDERVYGEIFTSDAFLDETDRVKRHAPVPPDDSTCKREKVVAAVMFLSDATMLTDFGTAKGWPIYFMLGNLSKYIRSQPDSGAMDHLAYIPSVS